MPQIYCLGKQLTWFCLTGFLFLLMWPIIPFTQNASKTPFIPVPPCVLMSDLIEWLLSLGLWAAVLKWLSMMSNPKTGGLGRQTCEHSQFVLDLPAPSWHREGNRRRYCTGAGWKLKACDRSSERVNSFQRGFVQSCVSESRLVTLRCTARGRGVGGETPGFGGGFHRGKTQIMCRRDFLETGFG